MKLLKKKATEAKKNVILVTSEAGLMPLAGAVGVHIAKSLQAKPEIPPNPNADEIDEGPVSLEDEPEEPDQIDANKSVGELAGAAAVGAAAANKNKADEPENIDFDNDAATDPMGLDDIDKDSKGDKPKKAKKVKPAKGIDGKSTKIPDFNKFRKILLIGLGALVLLVLLWIYCFKVLPKATIVVQTNTSSINTNLTLTLSQTTQTLDPTSDTVPAKIQTITKTSTSSAVNTTGTKTIGTSASGTITITNSNCNTTSVTVPAGTVFTDSSGNFNYTSNASTTVPGSQAEIINHKPVCTTPTDTVNVTAAAVGSSYNIGSTTYTSNDPDISGYSMNGSAMSGGSSSNVQVVAQADVNSAQNQLTSINSNQIEQQLEASLKSEGYQAITATYVAGKPTYTPSTAIGSQANTVTVTETVNYTMYGVMQSNLNTLVLNNVNQQINSSNQSILDTGVSSATFTQQQTSSNSTQVTMQASSTVGPKISVSTVAKQSVGQKSGDIKSSINQIPGVTNVTVKYSPFWVSATPNNIKKITVIIEKANGSQP